MFTIVDDQDYEWLNKWKWYAAYNKIYNNFYVYRYDYVNKKQKNVCMHRVILGITDSKIFIDHIDHNTLNNQRSNLRECSQSKNLMNSKKPRRVKETSSIYKGVYFNKQNKKWYGQIYINNKRIHLGLFKKEIEAAKAYDKKAKELFGEFALLNFKQT